MSSQDIWGEIEIDMLRAGIKQLEADKVRLLKQNQTMATCLNLMQGMLDRTGDCYKHSHKEVFIELERLVKVGLNERSNEVDSLDSLLPRVTPNRVDP